ncbi:MAG: LegC family aminotransferase [Pseudomonadota bacterium]
MLKAVRDVVGEQGGFTPLHEPEFAGNEAKYVLDCIETGWVSSVGSYVDRFERDLAEYTGARHAIATSNGTAALHVALLLAGVQAGDEVLAPALTFIATANAIRYANATPHFIDSEGESLGVDAAKLEAHLEASAHIENGTCINRATGAPIRALVIMHAFGHPADMAALSAVASDWHLRLVEDAAESLGSMIGERHAGTFGALASLSFNGNKTITTGGGGAILTDDPALAKRAKHLTTTAKVPHRWNFIHDEVGFNYRMPNLNAALGCAQLERLPDMLARKRRLAARYAERFAGLEGASFLPEPAGTTSNYWLCTLLLDQPDTAAHEGVLEALNDADLMARPVWTLMHLLPMFAEAPRADLSTAQALAARIINVPSSPKLSGPPA